MRIATGCPHRRSHGCYDIAGYGIDKTIKQIGKLKLSASHSLATSRREVYFSPMDNGLSAFVFVCKTFVYLWGALVTPLIDLIKIKNPLDKLDL
jgi:hypothetical protein